MIRNDKKKVQSLVQRVNSSNGEVVLILHSSYPLLYRISSRARKGDEDYQKLWKSLPIEISDFYPGLNI